MCDDAKNHTFTDFFVYRQSSNIKGLSMITLGNMIMKNMNIDDFLDEKRCFGPDNTNNTGTCRLKNKKRKYVYDSLAHKRHKNQYHLQPTTMAVWKFFSDEARHNKSVGIRLADIKKDKQMMQKLSDCMQVYNAKSDIHGSRIGECIHQLCKPEKSKIQKLKTGVLYKKNGLYFLSVDIHDIESVI